MREKCAVLGIKSGKDVFEELYYGLYALQHRGQESAGMALEKEGRIIIHKEMGLVSQVFDQIKLGGHLGIGHLRYSTRGESRIENAQPLVINYAKGSFALAHNGQIVNAIELKKNLETRGSIFSTTSDTEVLAHIIAREHIKKKDFVKALLSTMHYVEGSYSLTILHKNKLYAVRDPYGVRPLVYGRKSNTHVIASETCAIDAVGAEFIRDVRPSEVLEIGETIKSYRGPKATPKHCMFEYVYFSRPDSVIEGRPIFEVRKNLGKLLYREAHRKLPQVDVDLVIPVPNSGVTAAIGFSEDSGIYYSEGLMKNIYVGRTFILPEQGQREEGVKVKLNPIKSEVKDRQVVLIDDSIVRGTTLRRLINLLREAGAKEVHVRISCPPIRYPCHYGIDMQQSKEFVAGKKSIEKIRKRIGADSLLYQSLENLVKAIGLPKERLCLACLTGEYPIKKAQTKLTD